MKFFLKDFFSLCDQIRGFLRIWFHLLKKSQMENFIFCAGIIFHGFGTKMAPEAENGCTRIKMLSQLVLFTIAFPCRCFTVESQATVVPGLFSLLSSFFTLRFFIILIQGLYIPLRGNSVCILFISS